MTTTQTAQPVTTCPSWCTQHPSGETETHQSQTWQRGALSVTIETTGNDVPNVYADTVGCGLVLSEAEAHELGMALLRAADRIRLGRMEAGQ